VTSLLEVDGNTASLNSGTNEPKHVFFSFDAAKVYGTKVGRSSPTLEPVVLTVMQKHFMASPGIPSHTIVLPKEQKQRVNHVKPLWKLLIDRNMTKESRHIANGPSTATIAKRGKDGNVTTQVIARICEAMTVNINDICGVVKEPTK